MSEYVNATNTVFGIYETAGNASLAVDELIEAGFDSGAITVLFPENAASSEFAHRKGTRVPAGTETGPLARLPLKGTLGMDQPELGPRQGALPGALAAMGVEDDWYADNVRDGQILVSVAYRNEEERVRASEQMSRGARVPVA